VPYSSEHPADWTLELLAEGALAPEEQTRVTAHVEHCERCAAEVDIYRTLFSAMAALPRFAPSLNFADTVMARVTITPPTVVPEWLTAWLPSTRRGWALLLGLSLAPALPLIALVAWILWNPQVTAGGLVETGSEWLRDAGWSFLVSSAGWVVESRALAWAQLLVAELLQTPLEVLAAGFLVFAIGIPLSVWTLYRTLRTPPGGTTYAH
jgi:hypothetical protein